MEPLAKGAQRGSFLWQVGASMHGSPQGALLKVSLSGTKVVAGARMMTSPYASRAPFKGGFK